ncbi:MAG: hypothetical protein BM557_09355 [Flavobacterium sp. MedPE-SWcel]|uniref:DUF7683 domain-containing protein n=1 Tax=uncultured Flavobacterium sp. TaxID=165435 RepID=UPI00091ED8A7|nr:hypothetical protein [uncultured Flavobacterium sp.]OIQ16942.1 MAG: hypothetical protein BM557_09355 [Flavobacterium sp. MedPE-SWcel]
MPYKRNNIVKIVTYIQESEYSNDLINREINCSHIPITILRTIFNNVGDDYEMFLPYEINLEKSITLNSFMNPPIMFDFSKYEYALQRYGDYEAI